MLEIGFFSDNSAEKDLRDKGWAAHPLLPEMIKCLHERLHKFSDMMLPSEIISVLSHIKELKSCRS